MLTLEAYEELHRRYSWLVWLPVRERRAFVDALMAASAEEERRRIEILWHAAAERELVLTLTEPFVPVRPAA